MVDRSGPRSELRGPQSGWPDLNRRLPAPKAGALAKLSYTPLVVMVAGRMDGRKAERVHLASSNDVRNASASGPATNSFDPVTVT